ncbi:hypothetical protein [Tomitella biformata]|uniref:hypothetical protein n=1 Tax=Tomitella biformata TaxID=630403 RepID=UPI00046582C3|nr:hypothetical protein [Tomitella biformata]
MNLIGSTANSLWQVIAVGLLLGAGLPALFAIGLRSMYGGALGVDEYGETTTARPTVARMAVAYSCFAVVVGVVAAGIVLIVVNGGH